MEAQTAAIIAWCLTFLLPFHGALFLGARQERKRKEALVKMYMGMIRRR